MGKNYGKKHDPLRKSKAAIHVQALAKGREQLRERLMVELSAMLATGELGLNTYDRAAGGQSR